MELDQGVRELLTRMEGHWLGGMGFLLMGPSQSCHQSFHILDKLCSEQGVGDQLLLKVSIPLRPENAMQLILCATGN